MTAPLRKSCWRCRGVGFATSAQLVCKDCQGLGTVPLVYVESCRIGPHMNKAHRGGNRDVDCDCPCHMINRNNERNAWWPTFAEDLRAAIDAAPSDAGPTAGNPTHSGRTPDPKPHDEVWGPMGDPVNEKGALALGVLTALVENGGLSFNGMSDTSICADRGWDDYVAITEDEGRLVTDLMRQAHDAEEAV